MKNDERRLNQASHTTQKTTDVDLKSLTSRELLRLKEELHDALAALQSVDGRTTDDEQAKLWPRYEAVTKEIERRAK